jgi:hypothetical protein
LRCKTTQYCDVTSGAAKCVTGCYYNGVTYPHGQDDIDAGDHCNTCECNDGSITCTKDVCTECYYGEEQTEYQSGATWMDDCNECSCDTAVYMCEQKECGASCEYDVDEVYEHGQTWDADDGCNTCTCTDGEYKCTNDECILCWYNDESHEVGDGWTDGCNDCYCDEQGKSKCADICSCSAEKPCQEGYFCDIPTCDDTTGACFECTEENSCLAVPVCGCNGKTYANSMEAYEEGEIVRSYGECPACNGECEDDEVCCDGCFGAVECVKMGYGGQCPEPVCGGYGYY